MLRLLPIFLFSTLLAQSQPFAPDLFQEMRWRHIGPFRGGRTVAVSGEPSQLNVYYMAANNGGVWKSTDYCHTWKPIFEGQDTQSVGAIAVAPSDPQTIYIGSGEGLQRPDLSVGNGVYKTVDGGATWRKLGLRDGQQIPAILVDPKDARRLYVAVMGHPYGPNAERGVYRSVDGGETFQKILGKDENTGAIDLAFDPKDPRVLYADLWSARQGPWENGAFSGPGSGLFKSVDGGDTWKQLTGGLPGFAEGLGRIGIGVSPSNGKRIYLMVDASAETGGVWRSDDAGVTFQRINHEPRIWGRGADFAGVKVDPKNPDIVWVANTSTYRSVDGGRHFTAIKGAPGGDDYHTIWIQPEHPEMIFLGADQGATLSVNGGETWTTWYNQPTAQFYHVIADNRFPYWVYGGQQESGSAGVASRGDNGAITSRDWYPVGVEEYGYVAPDPLNPNFIYGGKVTRFDRTTGDVQNVGPELGRGKYRFLRTAPLLFSTVDPHTLFLGAQVLLKTSDGGNNWKEISPDLSRDHWDVPESVGVFSTPQLNKGPRRGVIYTVAPSYKDVNTIWAGTDDGSIHVTRNGGAAWKNVTPPGLTAWSKISLMDAGRFDAGTAYAAVNRLRLDDLLPHIYRTHDGGVTWKEIVAGLPANGPVNAVREDPVRRGLLYCGTETGVFFSVDDGDRWQALRLNLPATSVRDIVVHGDDLLAGTHGRGFWILDDVTPLRQVNATVASAGVFLFQPADAYRVRRNQNTDTPLPPEEPAGQNPPDGAMLDYYLRQSGPVVLEVFDSAGHPVRRWESSDKPLPVETDLNVPTYWVRQTQPLLSSPGMHRFIWDLHYAPAAALDHEYPISAIVGDTPRLPLGPSVLPGRYVVKLTAGGSTLTRSLVIKMDPRVKTPPAGLTRKFTLAKKLYDLMEADFGALQEVRQKRASGGGGKDAELAALEGSGGGRRAARGASSQNLTRLNGELAQALGVIEGTDSAPTPQAVATVSRLTQEAEGLLAAWEKLKKQ